MLCSTCNQTPATVHLYEVKSREERELCTACATAEGLIPQASGLSSTMLQNLEALQLPIELLRAKIEEELQDRG